MLKIKVIGCGAAGNKAAIELHKKGFDLKNITLINSTSRDIPADYKNNSIIFGASNETLGGCGKERNVGKALLLKDLKTGSIDIDSIVDPDTNVCIIVSSTEGGSGSGVIPILAKYIVEVIGVPVITCLFFGFNTDVRGMGNSVELCQEINSNYGVIGISNAAFLDEANGNKVKAENLANEEFCKIVRILTGQDIKPGSQNIDDTDLYKLVVTPGYMFVGSCSLKGVKNVDMFNKTISATLDNSHLIESASKSVKRIGAIFSIPQEMSDSVDYNADVFCQRYGTPYEMFTHIQDQIESTPSISWIVAGMDLPLNEVKEIFENYKKASSEVNKKKDSFFETIASFTGNGEDAMFDMLNRSQRTPTTSKAKNSFFEEYGMDAKK